MASNSGIASGNDDNSTDGNAPKTVSVLFICLGNICRSTMAEAVFRHITSTSSHPRLSISKIDSAGTASYHVGSEPDSRTMSTLVDNGIKDYIHQGRQVSIDDFAEFDYILAMDRENLRNLQRLSSRKKRPTGATEAKVMLFGDFGGVKGEEVIDPYYGARDGFDVAYKQMVRFTNGFIQQVWG